MRQDQYERLQKLEEKLMDVYLVEADTEHWPGHGIELSNMDKSTRGDRYWSKRNAAATASLIMRTQNLIGTSHGIGTTLPAAPGADAEDEAAQELDRELATAEAAAERMRADVIKRARATSRNAKPAG
jgi:hypothetical protein